MGQVIDAIDGFVDKERERTKVMQILQWETTRWQTWVMFNLWADKKHKINDPSKLMKFDWEDESKAPTKEEWDQIVNIFPDTPRNGSK